MRRHSRRHRKSSSVDLNLAAMLDMAFQLLAFFILTFRPAPIEGQLAMHLPPPIPVTNVKSDKPQTMGGDGSDISGLEKLDLYINANSLGEVSQIKVGMRPVVQGRLDASGIAALKRHMKEIFEIQQIPFDRIQLIVDDRLHYEELMKVVDICTQQVLPDGQKMQRISFVSATR
ncbi:MAG: Biopolymer transport protein ExbD/TolR [Planctomycetaceae bacterium]|nr:Biopolymer transport protein ExbD/TolR [Planctomycetaceae bacterium]